MKPIGKDDTEYGEVYFRACEVLFEFEDMRREIAALKAQSVRSDVDIHLAHCFQAPYETSCKYGDYDCPATPKAQPVQERCAISDYQATFNAIADATNQGPNGLGISVKKFWESYRAATGRAQPVQSPLPDPQLCKFYQVETFPALVEAQARHIEKLQAKLPRSTEDLAFKRVREG